jgi:glycosyltransferase involved in cell wall biosynthesis
MVDRGHAVSLCLPENSTFWELKPEPFWHPLPTETTKWRAPLEKLLPKNPAEPTIIHAFHNKAVKRIAWWGLFWMKRNLACVAHRGVLYRPGNPLPYISPAMRAFIVNSRACADAIGIYAPKRKIRIVANAVPDERVSPTVTMEEMRRALGLEDTKICFVYIGNDSPVKGADQLLRSYAAANLPQTRLIMIGTSPARWHPLCRELGIEHLVRHAGEVENVADYLQIADAFVFPSIGKMDSFPNVLLEAMRMGLPVVASKVGGIPEIAQNNGILVKPGDLSALSGALAEMANMRDQRVKWSGISLELGKRYSVTARCEALEAIYGPLVRPL